MIDDPTLERVLAAFGIAPRRVAAAGGTAGRTWRVDADERSYFCRCRGVRTSSAARIAFDHAVRRHLVDHGFPTVAPLLTRDGAAYVPLDGEVYELYPWVEGRGYSAAIAESARDSSARMLARFHDLTRGVNAACESHVPQFTHFDPPIDPRPRFDDPAAFLDVIDHMIDRFGGSADLGAMRAARQRVQWLARQYDPLYARLPHGVIHGDYHGMNMLFDDRGEVIGVFDYDWTWREARVRDLGGGMRFFGTRRDGPLDSGSIWSMTACKALDADAIRRFVAAYERQSPLSADERAALPYALIARCVASRLEGIMKVPAERRVEFMLMDFERPFEWFDAVGGVI